MRVRKSLYLYKNKQVQQKFKYLLLLFVTSLLVYSCDDKVVAPPDEFEISADFVSFTAPAGSYYSGATASHSIQIKNTGNTRWKFWIGCSVRDRSGVWYDIPIDTVTLNPLETSKQINMSWKVPPDKIIVSGSYLSRAAIWKSDPSSSGAVRLDMDEIADAFDAFNFIDEFNSFNNTRWVISNKLTPGYGRFTIPNIIVENGILSVKFPKLTKDGGEIKTVSPAKYKYGSYRASIKTPLQLPGTYTTFFLYEGTNLDEIDIEIWNDGTRRIDFNTWVKGVQKFSAQVVLPFNPGEQFHEYRIDYYPNEVSFWVDNVKLKSTVDILQIPTTITNIYLSGWWPKWMTGDVASTDNFARYEWVKH